MILILMIDFIFYPKYYIFASSALIEESSLKIDESAISVKLSGGVKFEGIKVYFSKIKD